MKRVALGIVAFAFGTLLVMSTAVSQPPGGKGDKDGKEGKFGPPRFELGQVFPPPLLVELNLTPAQEKELETIKQDLKAKLDKLLTAEQKTTVENFRPRGPGGFGGPGEKGGKGGFKGGKGDKGDFKGDKGEKGDKGGPDRPPFEKKDE
jgi:hypothetical protein